jgi:hypothetical protein
MTTMFIPQSKKLPSAVAGTLAGLIVILALQSPGLAASDTGQQTPGTKASLTESGSGQVRRVWVLTTDNRPVSDVDSGAKAHDETPIQYELKCEAGRLQSAQRSYSGMGYGQSKTWAVTVNAELLSRGGSSVLNSALETVCGV